MTYQHFARYFAGWSLALLLLPTTAALAVEADAGNNRADAITLEQSLAVRQLPAGRAEALEAAFADAPVDHLHALAFLLEHMPEHDVEQLDIAMLQENIEYACRVREEVNWSDELTDELFYNYVLPYASVNEKREAWRKDFYERFIEIARECETPGEAAVRLNREVFPALSVRYHATRRQKPDQSPSESIELGYASCTGLSIILVDACRAVGVPARVAGIPDWGGRTGNHTWTEVWDGCWHFTGSAEPANSLDITWFAGRASKADPTQPQTSIYASSFMPAHTQFPMVWARHLDFVPAYEVTSFYTTRRQVTVQPGENVPADARVSLYLREQLVAAGPLADEIKFDLAGNETYQAVIRNSAGEVLATQTVELGDEAEPTVTLSAETVTVTE